MSDDPLDRLIEARSAYHDDPPPGRHGPGCTCTARNLPRAHAVTTLTSMITSGSHHIIGIDSHQITPAAYALAHLPGRVYYDRGVDTVLDLSCEEAPEAAADLTLATLTGIEICAIATVPVGAASRAGLLEAAGASRPASTPDGVEILLSRCGCTPAYVALWPGLLVEALAVYDPRWAIQIRADAIVDLS